MQFSGYLYGHQAARSLVLSMPTCKLTKPSVDALPASAEIDVIWWDEDLKGFGLKLTPAGRKIFLVQYRPAGDRRNPRKYTT
jgi:hypothetical protein